MAITDVAPPRDELSGQAVRVYERRNELLRTLVGVAVAATGAVLAALWLLRVSTYRLGQAFLRWRYAIAASTPVRTYGAALEADIAKVKTRLGTRAYEVLTSGSTRQPKKILYSRWRLQMTRLVYMDVFCRMFWQLGVRRKSLFVFAPLSGDQSLTSLLVKESRLPSRFACVQAPYRLLGQPVIRELAARYDPQAIRLWFLAVANPGVLYATNPSTLAAFFGDLDEHWTRGKRLAVDFTERPEVLPRALMAIYTRIAAPGAQQRLRAIVASEQALSASSFLPGLEAFVCWDGGYVRPFLEMLRRYLPASRYRHIPMYSMSTETVETLGTVAAGAPAFLPLAPGVHYEFLPEGADDAPAQLLSPWQLVVGSRYTMIVSDAYGLRRYQTDDVFACQRWVWGLPDLRFVQRRTLSFSWTGEKVTGEQASAALAAVRPLLAHDVFLTCVPSWPAGDRVPHYRLVVGDPTLPVASEVATAFEQALRDQNSEFASKLDGHRLGRVRLAQVSLHEFTARMGGGPGWEAQFKFLPLYARPWEPAP